MTSKELYNSYERKKKQFHEYIDNVKQNSSWDIYTIINPTLIKNPYASEFPKNFFIKTTNKSNKSVSFIKYSISFYVKQIYSLLSYFIAFTIYKLFYRKSVKINNTLINVTLLTDDVISQNKYNENYFKSLYPILDNYNYKYTFMPRLYGVKNNPFKLIKLFKIINKDKRSFLFEYEFLTILDFFKLFTMIIKYPFKTLRLIEDEKSLQDELFNQSLIQDISNMNFDAFTKYLYGEKIAGINTLKYIYSWSEFQVTERSFNYGIKTNNKTIQIIACQFFLNYETYFNTYVDDIDFNMLSAPDEVLVNGKYYIRNINKVKYRAGVSLRYKAVFEFRGIKKESNILLLGSYIESDTKYMLESVKYFENVIFKNHPAVDINKFGVLPKNITVSNDNIYKLFENAKLAIGAASGTCVEAAASGVSVIIIASQDNLTSNPLVEHGKGKIWDIAFSKDEVNFLYNKLIDFRKNNPTEIEDIASWYRDNFFIEPNEENIVKVFKLNLKNK